MLTLVIAWLALAQDPTDSPDAWARVISAQIEAHEFADALEQAALTLEDRPDDGATLAPNGEANGREPPPKLAELERRVPELDPRRSVGVILPEDSHRLDLAPTPR